jgi:hypothetical protein
MSSFNKKAVVQWSSLFAAAALNVLAAQSARAGEGGFGAGNGGIGIVCRHLKGPKKGSPKSVQILDLAEFEGFVPESSLDVQTQFDQAMGKLSEAGLDGAAQKIIQQDTWISNHTGSPMGGLPLTFKDDALDRVSESAGCRHEQIAVYNVETGMLSRDADLYEMLSKTAKTALRIHEAAYAIAAAKDAAVDSKRTRQFVRTVLSKSPAPTELQRSLPFSQDAREEYAAMLKAPRIAVLRKTSYTHADFVGTYVMTDGKDELVHRFDLAGGLFNYRTAEITKLNPGTPLEYNGQNAFYGLNGPNYVGERTMQMAHATSEGLWIVWTILSRQGGGIAHQMSQKLTVNEDGDLVMVSQFRDGDRDDAWVYPTLQQGVLKRVQN